MIVHLKDVIKRANTKEDQSSTDKKYYVAGEHIPGQSLTVRDYGLIEGSAIGPMFYFGFVKGQVLLPSRSIESRKAAIATFDGLCSEKTFVLETVDDGRLRQLFVPILLQSDLFWKYADENKGGSVNHFLNWSSLAEFEFELPDVVVQDKYCKVIWALEDLIHCLE